MIDEPTNHLDQHARQIVSDYLQRKKGFILVSHDRTFLDACIDHILSINKTNIEIQKGNFSTWYYNKQLQDSFETAENEKLVKNIKAMESAARRTARWSDTIEKRKSRNSDRDAGVKPDKGPYRRSGCQNDEALPGSAEAETGCHRGEIQAAQKNIERADSLKIHPLSFHTDPLITFEDVSVRYGKPRSSAI